MKDEMECAFQSNSCGAGFAIANGHCIDVHKGFFTFDSLWKELEPALALRRPMLIHFRLATHGARDASNCHPFKFVANGIEYALIHNGIISGFGGSYLSKGKSDTLEFTEKVVLPLFDLIPDPMCERLADVLEHASDGSNKIAIMRQDGAIMRTCSSGWHRKRKTIYSNDSYKYDIYTGAGGWQHEDEVWVTDYEKRTGLRYYNSSSHSYVPMGAAQAAVAKQNSWTSEGAVNEWQEEEDDAIVWACLDTQMNKMSPERLAELEEIASGLMDSGYAEVDAYQCAMDMVANDNH